MSISAPRYTVGSVQRLGRTSRTLAIFRREFLRGGGWGTYLGIGLIYAAVIIIITVTAEFASFIGGVSASTFEAPYESPVWPFLVLIIATSVGAGSISEDIGNRSIVLYLSRPIHLSDYLWAKASAIGAWLTLATVGPGVVGVAIVTALGLAPGGVAATAAAAFLGSGLLTAIFFTGVALAFSSLTTRSLYAGVAIFGVVLSLFVGVSVVYSITGNANVRYADPITDLHSVAQALFGVSGTPATDPTTSAVILLVAGVVLALLALWRLTRIEVVGE